jgi:hypothetical protein
VVFSVIALAMSCASCAADTNSEHAGGSETEPPPHFRVGRFVSDSAVELIEDQNTYPLTRGERHGVWTFMGIASGQHSYAVLEDFQTQDSHILFVDAGGVQIDLPKSSESNIKNPDKLFSGHSRDEVLASAQDLLGNAVLSQSGDPEYAGIKDILPKAGVTPPGDKDVDKSPTLEGFIGSPDTSDKIYFVEGVYTPNFLPTEFQPSIAQISQRGAYLQGLVGGYLPAVRYVYPEADGAWTEMVAFAPFRTVNGNDRQQPVWYRLSRIESGTLKWSRYFDSYPPYLPVKSQGYGVEDGKAFYADFIKFRERWNEILDSGMKISLPDKRVENMTRFSLVGSIMTRAGDFPRYGIPSEGGVVGYGGSPDDGFPDTFTDQTDAMLDWGLLDLAGRYIDNYLAYFAREDGSILYYGPETGQYGRMLAIFAKYLNEGGNAQVLLKNKSKIEGIVTLLLKLRAEALTLPAGNPAHGLLSGKSEADTFPDPRFIQPFFSNSTEAVRGFHDFGEAWHALGSKINNVDMSEMGARLVREAASLREDLTASLASSTLLIDGEKILPTFAGAKLPPDVAMKRDESDPQADCYRVYMEMLHSGVLPADQIELIREYLSNHHGLVLGLPSTLYKGRYTSFGFLSSGYGYSLIQTDHIREALLNLYSGMANQYTRGTWITPEERDPLTPGWARPPYGNAHYSVSAQVTVANIVRWLLVFEDPESNTLWLGKGIPAKWLEDGNTVTVEDAPTRWGRVSFSTVSQTKSGAIEALVRAPETGIPAQIKIRLRTGPAFRIKSVTLNGQPWTQFDPDAQVILIPPGIEGAVKITARD